MVDLLFPFWFIFPSYVANAFPVVVGKIRFFCEHNFPLDLGASFWDGGRVLGDGKTFAGFVLGVLAGTLIGWVQGGLWLGFLLSFGTLVGDSVGSFVKRRFGVGRGKNFPIIDDLFFLIFALGFAWPVARLGWVQVVELLVLTPVLHRLTNIIAYYWGLKEVPW